MLFLKIYLFIGIAILVFSIKNIIEAGQELIKDNPKWMIAFALPVFFIIIIVGWPYVLLKDQKE